MQSGVPPSAREGAAAVALGSDIYIFGGVDGNFDRTGFVDELHVLHTDTMSSYAASVRCCSSTAVWGDDLCGGMIHWPLDTLHTATLRTGGALHAATRGR